MEVREQQQGVSISLGVMLALVALLPATAALDSKWVILALAAAALCLFKAVLLLSVSQASILLHRHRVFEWLLVALLAGMVLSVLRSPWPDAGWIDLEQLAPALVIAVFAHNLEPDPKGRHGLAWLLTVAAVLVSIYALLQLLGIEFVQAYKLQGLRRRAMAGFGNPTFLAAWLVVVWPFCLLLWMRGRRLFAGFAMAMMAAALLGTQTRSGIFALAVQALLCGGAVFYLHFTHRQRGQRLALIVSLGAAFALVAVLVLPIETWTRPTQRLALWAASLHLWLQHPLLGFGPGSYVLAMQKHLPSALAHSLEATRQFAEHPHNFFLSWLCDGGALMASLSVALLVYCMRGPWSVLQIGRRQRREFHEGEMWLLVLALGVIGLLAQNLFDRNLKLAGSASMYWVMLGWMAPLGPPGNTRRVDVGTRRIAGGLLMGFSLVLAWMAVKPVSDYRLLKSQDTFVGQKVDEASSREKDIAKYLFQNPEDAEAWENYGESLARQKKFSQAAQAYERALALQPMSAVAMMNLGNCYFLMNRWDKAQTQFKKLIEIHPEQADAYFNLGYVYYYKNKMELAVKSLEKALELNPDHAGARKLKKTILSQ